MNSENNANSSNPPNPIDKRKTEERRRFLRSAFLTAFLLGTPLVGLSSVVRGRVKRLRPPGALDEPDFLSSCIKCGQCIQVCPVNALKPGDLLDGFGIGVPFIEPRAQACDFSCDVMQCALACPTGALTYHKPEFLPVRPGAPMSKAPVLLAKKQDAENTLNLTERMGIARLKRPEACLAVQGKGVKGSARGENFRGKKRYVEVDRWKPVPVREHSYDVAVCDLCVRECPIAGAISLQNNTPTVTEACVGCGVCEMMCPVEPSAIEIEARGVWKNV